MTIRYLADADLNQRIVTGATRREPALDFLTARAAGLRGLGDREVLALAADLNRILVSHDSNTMPRWFGTFQDEGETSPGLILIPQGLSIGRAIDDLILVWAASGPEEWRNRLLWIPL